MNDKLLKQYVLHLSTFDNIFKKHVHNNSTLKDKEIFEEGLKEYIHNVKNILIDLKEHNKIEEYNFISKRISLDFKLRGLGKLEILIHS